MQESGEGDADRLGGAQGRESGGAIDVGGGRHVHFADAQTTQEDGHRHRFRVAALIQDPIGD